MNTQQSTSTLTMRTKAILFGGITVAAILFVAAATLLISHFISGSAATESAGDFSFKLIHEGAPAYAAEFDLEQVNGQ